MSWFWTNLIFWGSLIWLPWLEYAMLRNEAKPKKNIVVGVTLPYAAQARLSKLAISKSAPN